MKRERDKPRRGVVANTLKLPRVEASLLAKAFGVGFIEWLEVGTKLVPDLLVGGFYGGWLL